MLTTTTTTQTTQTQTTSDRRSIVDTDMHDAYGCSPPKSGGPVINYTDGAGQSQPTFKVPNTALTLLDSNVNGDLKYYLPEKWFYGAISSIPFLRECGMSLYNETAQCFKHLQSPYYQVVGDGQVMAFDDIKTEQPVDMFVNGDVSLFDIVDKYCDCEFQEQHPEILVAPRDYWLHFYFEEQRLKGVAGPSMNYAILCDIAALRAMHHVSAIVKTWIAVVFMYVGIPTFMQRITGKISRDSIASIPYFSYRNYDKMPRCKRHCDTTLCDTCYLRYMREDFVQAMLSGFEHKRLLVLFSIYEGSDEKKTASIRMEIDNYSRVCSFRKWSLTMHAMKYACRDSFLVAAEYFYQTPSTFSELSEFLEVLSGSVETERKIVWTKLTGLFRKNFYENFHALRWGVLFDGPCVEGVDVVKLYRHVYAMARFIEVNLFEITKTSFYKTYGSQKTSVHMVLNLCSKDYMSEDDFSYYVMSDSEIEYRTRGSTVAEIQSRALDEYTDHLKSFSVKKFYKKKSNGSFYLTYEPHSSSSRALRSMKMSPSRSEGTGRRHLRRNSTSPIGSPKRRMSLLSNEIIPEETFEKEIAAALERNSLGGIETPSIVNSSSVSWTSDSSASLSEVEGVIPVPDELVVKSQGMSSLPLSNVDFLQDVSTIDQILDSFLPKKEVLHSSFGSYPSTAYSYYLVTRKDSRYYSVVGSYLNCDIPISCMSSEGKESEYDIAGTDSSFNKLHRQGRIHHLGDVASMMYTLVEGGYDVYPSVEVVPLIMTEHAVCLAKYLPCSHRRSKKHKTSILCQCIPLPFLPGIAGKIVRDMPFQEFVLEQILNASHDTYDILPSGAGAVASSMVMISDVHDKKLGNGIIYGPHVIFPAHIIAGHENEVFKVKLFFRISGKKVYNMRVVASNAMLDFAVGRFDGDKESFESMERAFHNKFTLSPGNSYNMASAKVISLVQVDNAAHGVPKNAAIGKVYVSAEAQFLDDEKRFIASSHALQRGDSGSILVDDRCRVIGMYLGRIVDTSEVSKNGNTPFFDVRTNNSLFLNFSSELLLRDIPRCMSEKQPSLIVEDLMVEI